MIIQNSIEPSNTGNCTHFGDALCESSGLLDFSWKRSQTVIEFQSLTIDDPDTVMAEKMLIKNDMHHPNIPRDNVLYYVLGFIVQSLLTKLQCANCKAELLLDPDNSHASHVSSYPMFARFTVFKQQGGLIFPSVAVLKIVKTTKTMLRSRVVGQNMGINTEKNLDLKIGCAVFAELGPDIFNNVLGHFFEHGLGIESDHPSSLLRIVARKHTLT